jgi:sugar lactone lactonase YvrE
MKTLLALLLALPAQAYDNIKFLDPLKADEMTRPVAASAWANRVYVLDEKKGLLIFEDGKILKVAGGGLKNARGIASGADGTVYVADTGNNRIVMFDKDGGSKGSFGMKGSEPGRLKGPASVAVGADGRVYVADTGNDRVQAFTQDGILLFQFGGNTTVKKEQGLFSGPSKIALDPSDNIYVLDEGNERIQKFDSSAKFVREFPLLGADFGVDVYGFMYVLDPSAGKVVEQDPAGQILGKFGSSGKGSGQFKKPQGVAVAPDGSVIIADTGNARLMRVELANKLKSKPLPVNTVTKLSVTGPSRKLSYAATQLAVYGDDLYAYIPAQGQFVVLGADGKEKKRFGKAKGKGADVTRGTEGMAASEKHGLYVSDTPNNRLQHFALDGKHKANHLESSGMFDSKAKEGRVKSPRGVAINDDGSIYIANAGNARVDAVSPEGVFLFGFGPSVGPHTMEEPVSLAWDKAGFIYVADKSAARVIKAEPSGAFIAELGGPGKNPGQYESPVSVVYDGNSYVYVLDSVLRRVSVYNKEGRWLSDLFAGGPGSRELTEPVSLAIQGSSLLIADKGKGAVIGFDLHPLLAAPAAIKAEAVEGVLTLTWMDVKDPWRAGYRVFRADKPNGPFEEVGQTEKNSFQDATTTPEQVYYYRVATEAKTKDLGPVSNTIEAVGPEGMNKAPVEITTMTVGNIFSANYKWYLKNSLGKITVQSNVKAPLQNVKVTFRLKDFMDFGYDTEIKRLEPKGFVEVPLIATLNNKILEVTEDTPIQAEFTLTFYREGKQESTSITKPLRVYSRNAITWEDPQRIANFVTPKDPPILEFMRESLRQAPKSTLASGLNTNLVTAVHLWDSLSEAGVKFFSNPNSPYESVSEDPNFPVDYTQFPRETLKRKTGQCDDLVTLLMSMLDGAKVRTAILDYPGHMALMFDTEADEAEEAGLPESGLIKHDGTYWVPLEATLIGKPFHEAYEKALYAYKTEKEKGKVTIIDVRKAWQTYEPATMPATEWTPVVPPAKERQERFSAAVAALAADRYKYLKKLYSKEKDVESLLALGLLEHQNGNKEAAMATFNKALELDPTNPAVLNNLGNLSFMAGDHAGAEAHYLKAVKSDPEDASIWLNLTKTQVKLKNLAKAQEYAKKATGIDKSLEPTVETILKAVR